MDIYAETLINVYVEQLKLIDELELPRIAIADDDPYRRIAAARLLRKL